MFCSNWIEKDQGNNNYQTGTSGTDTIAKAREEGREKLELRLYQKGLCKCKAEDPKDIDGQSTA